ncbi:MAG: preprotein translocase subunit YajC [Actinomycetota bacterium]|jgi:preprotein translocase subunit YajC
MVQLLAQSSGGSSYAGLLIPVLLLGVFYFLLIRPQQRRAKEQQALIRSVEEGDEIVMTSGIIGTIVAIDEDDDTLTVEIAPGTQVRILRAGVGRRLTADDEDYDDEDYDEDEDGDEGGEHDTSDEQQGPIQQL